MLGAVSCGLVLCHVMLCHAIHREVSCHVITCRVALYKKGTYFKFSTPEQGNKLEMPVAHTWGEGKGKDRNFALSVTFFRSAVTYIM